VEALVVRRLVLAAAAVVACGESAPESGRAPTAGVGAVQPAFDPASLVTADTVTVEVPLSLPAQLYVEHDAAIYARSPGIVESILADLGTRVNAGQLLARLESADQAIALA
jgi:multidrug efflux pump subunit AcrA (membrane-fusion protein)